MSHSAFRPERPRVATRHMLGTILLLLSFSFPPTTRLARGGERRGQDAEAPAAQGEKPSPAEEGVRSKPSKDPQETQPPPFPEKTPTAVNPITGFGAVSGLHYVPLTGRQRWRLYRRQNFSTVGAYFGPVMSSLVDQIDSRPPEWNRDIEGYGKRLASRYGTNLVQGTVEAAGCAALGHDPRYVRSEESGGWRRVRHAFLFSFLTKNKNGENRIAIATLGSFYAAGMVTQSWMPERYTALGDGVREGNRQLLLSVGLNQFQEFWPEIRRLVFRKR